MLFFIEKCQTNEESSRSEQAYVFTKAYFSFCRGKLRILEIAFTLFRAFLQIFHIRLMLKLIVYCLSSTVYLTYCLFQPLIMLLSFNLLFLLH